MSDLWDIYQGKFCIKNRTDLRKRCCRQRHWGGESFKLHETKAPGTEHEAKALVCALLSSGLGFVQYFLIMSTLFHHEMRIFILCCCLLEVCNMTFDFAGSCSQEIALVLEETLDFRDCQRMWDF